MTLNHKLDIVSVTSAAAFFWRFWRRLLLTVFLNLRESLRQQILAATPADPEVAGVVQGLDDVLNVGDAKFEFL